MGLSLLALGCGGNGDSSSSASKFAGTYDGTWVHVGDATDTGPSLWIVDNDGHVQGYDDDPGRDTTFLVVGSIDSAGNLSTVSTPGSGEAASLNGKLTLDGTGKLAGVLVWGTTPPLSYQYTFQRR